MQRFYQLLAVSLVLSLSACGGGGSSSGSGSEGGPGDVNAAIVGVYTGASTVTLTAYQQTDRFSYPTQYAILPDGMLAGGAAAGGSGGASGDNCAIDVPGFFSGNSFSASDRVVCTFPPYGSCTFNRKWSGGVANNVLSLTVNGAITCSDGSDGTYTLNFNGPKTADIRAKFKGDESIAVIVDLMGRLR